MQTPFWERIQKVRNTELDTLWKSFRVQTFNSFLLNAIPTFVSVGTFTVYVLLGNRLTAAKAFTSLSLFSVGFHAVVASLPCHVGSCYVTICCYVTLFCMTSVYMLLFCCFVAVLFDCCIAVGNDCAVNQFQPHIKKLKHLLYCLQQVSMQWHAVVSIFKG